MISSLSFFFQQQSNNASIVRPPTMSSVNFTTNGKQSNLMQAATNIVPNPLSVITTANQLQFSGMQQEQQSPQIGASPDQNTDLVATNVNQQITQMAINSWNPKMLQKIAQRLIVDTSSGGTVSGDSLPGNQASNASSPTGSSSDESIEESPVSSSILNVKPNSNSMYFEFLI